MNKVKAYKITGNTCFILWFIIVAGIAIMTAHVAVKAGHGKFLNGTLLFFIINGFLHFFLNPLLLIGSIFFWRAEKNENPAKKSALGRSLLLYLIS